MDDTGSELNYGAGKSKFYAASDRGSHASVSKLLPTNPNKDHTLYLSRYMCKTEIFHIEIKKISINKNRHFFHRSTFYNDQPASSNKGPEIWNSDNLKVS